MDPRGRPYRVYARQLNQRLLVHNGDPAGVMSVGTATAGRTLCSRKSNTRIQTWKFIGTRKAFSGHVLLHARKQQCSTRRACGDTSLTERAGARARWNPKGATCVEGTTIAPQGGPKTDPERVRKCIRQSACWVLPETRRNLTRQLRNTSPSKTPTCSSGFYSARRYGPAQLG